MHPEFLTILGRTFYWYGVMMALAFLSGILLWRHLARRKGQDADYGSDLALWVLLPGIVGARLLYVVANYHVYSADPATIWRIDQGGLIFYGGIIGGAIGAFCFARRRKEPLAQLMDFLVVAIPLGHMFGRIGCFLNGCCYGLPSPIGWGISVTPESCGGCGVSMAGDPTPRYPVQLYEAGGNLLVFIALYAMYRRQPKPGLVSAVYLLLYPALRFSLEMLRGDDRLMYWNLTGAQWLSLALMIAGLIILAIHAYRYKPSTTVHMRGKGSEPAP